MYLSTEIRYRKQPLMHPLDILLESLQFVHLVQWQNIHNLLVLFLQLQKLENVELLPLICRFCNFHNLFRSLFAPSHRQRGRAEGQRTSVQIRTWFYYRFERLNPVGMARHQQGSQAHAITWVYVAVGHWIAQEKRCLFY